MIVGLICIALTVIGTLSVPAKSILDIPLLAIFAGEDQLEVARDSLKQDIDIFDEQGGENPEAVEEFEDIIGLRIEDVEEMLEVPSFNTLIKVSEAMKEVLEAGETAELEDMLFMFKLLRAIIYGYGAFIVFLSLLATLRKKKWLTILALVFSLPLYLFLIGPVLTILFIVASITHVVLLSKEKKASAVPPHQAYPPYQPYQ